MQIAILLGLVYAFAWSMDNIAGSSFMDRPIICGALTGLVMGDFEQGLIIGGTLELVWMGFISYAGIINGETRIGAILGTYFAIATGNSFDVAISIAMPIAILGANISNAYNILVSFLMHKWADKWAEEGNYRSIGRFHIGVGLVKLAFMTSIVVLTVLLGTDAITQAINFIPQNIITGLGKAGEVLTAVGFGMLLNILWDKRFIGLYFVGFAAAAFLNLNVMAITIIATGLAFVFMYANNKGDEESYD
ncbi:MAG: PTS sugar transporter subunit IIC [Bacilli bacterium]|uniref:PTS mannose/fructose/sorbose/N-acetylgalactosamine transporter subunit IIC n=1 Tax=Anaerorhabdus sp. TaxID=1872524 RepID=UPI002FCBF837